MDIEKKLSGLTSQMDDHEARSRRYSIHVFGVKEGSKGKGAVAYFETWLPKVLNMETKKGRICFDHCH